MNLGWKIVICIIMILQLLAGWIIAENLAQIFRVKHSVQMIKFDMKGIENRTDMFHSELTGLEGQLRDLRYDIYWKGVEKENDSESGEDSDSVGDNSGSGHGS